jgi:hypothetical protein
MVSNGSVADPQKPVPLLRCIEGNMVKVCSAGVAVMGKPVHTDGEILLIDGARQRRSGIYIADLATLAETLGGRSATLGLLLDAIEHGDQIRVGVTRDRVTYDNPAQIARLRAGS